MLSLTKNKVLQYVVEFRENCLETVTNDYLLIFSSLLLKVLQQYKTHKEEVFSATLNKFLSLKSIKCPKQNKHLLNLYHSAERIRESTVFIINNLDHFIVDCLNKKDGTKP